MIPPGQIGPPPAQDVLQQQQPAGAGPFGQAAQQPPSPPAAPQGPNGSSQESVQGTAQVVQIHLQQMMQDEPALTPFLQHAISDIQAGLTAVFTQRQANQQATMPTAASNTPSSEPGAGLPPM